MISTDQSSIQQEMGKTFQIVGTTQRGGDSKHWNVFEGQWKSPVKLVQFENRENKAGEMEESTKQM